VRRFRNGSIMPWIAHTDSRSLLFIGTNSFVSLLFSPHYMRCSLRVLLSSGFSRANPFHSIPHSASRIESWETGHYALEFYTINYPPPKIQYAESKRTTWKIVSRTQHRYTLQNFKDRIPCLSILYIPLHDLKNAALKILTYVKIRVKSTARWDR